jgi:hypothetical protein
VKELTDSYDLVSDATALRTRLATDGYLFFRGLLPVDVVTDVHEQLARILYDSDWLARDADPGELVASGRAVEEGSAGFFGAYRAIQSTLAFHELAVRPELIGLASRLLGEEAFAHPAHICRIAPPSPGANPTPIHQDYRFIQGCVDTLTTWLPLSAAGDRWAPGVRRIAPPRSTASEGVRRAGDDAGHTLGPTRTIRGGVRRRTGRATYCCSGV